MLTSTFTASLILALLPGIPSADAETKIVGAGADRFGYQIVSADLNSDGDPDLVIAAPDQTGGNAVYVFYGPIDLASTPSLGTGDADVVIDGPSGAEFGWSIAVGDVVGSGDIDLIVAAPSEGANGTVYAFAGPLPSMSTTMDVSDAALEVRGHESEYTGATGYAGWSVTAGDFDGDGEDELVIGACLAAGPGQGDRAGVAYILDAHGQSGSITTASATTRIGGAGFTGCSLANAGDFNGDGYADLLVGSTRSALNGQPSGGLVSLVYGRPSLPSAITLDTTSLAELKNDDVTHILPESGLSGANLGYDMAPAGDVNGDGYADLLIGAPAIECFYDNLVFAPPCPAPVEHVGRTYLILGGPDVDGDRVLAGLSEADDLADVIWEGGSWDWSGISVASSGFAGELYSRWTHPLATPFYGPLILIGSGEHNAHAIAYDAEFRAGKSPEYACEEDSETGLFHCTLDRANMPASRHVRRELASLGFGGHLLESVANDYFGLEVHGPVDLDGDGLGDLVIGAPDQKTFYDGAGDGQVFLFAGQ